jgi:tetratricopeptide (TPR) repeat protein
MQGHLKASSNNKKYQWLDVLETLSVLGSIGGSINQTIRINPDNANAYYNRGLTYQHLGNKNVAIGDYTEAIRINPSYAEAYHSWGLARADLKDKKGAVEDLREAAKLFFDAGDIANYQTARDLSKKFHELSLQPGTDASEEVTVECLFA